MVASLGTSVSYHGVTQRYFDKNVLPFAQRHMVVRQFAQKIKIPDRMGLTYTGTRFNRLVLPFAPLNEGVPPIGQAPSFSQVTGVVNQWGDKVNLTDISELTPFIDVLAQATKLLRVQVTETYERNMFMQLNSATQVNFVNTRGARGSLQSGDVLDPTTVIRTIANLETLGAYQFNGPTGTDPEKDIEEGPRKATKGPRESEHFVCVAHPLVMMDFSNNSTVQLAWSYSDINKLYINEVGQWRGMHFVKSNMVPSWTGFANNANGAAYSPQAGGGNLATNANYFITITGSDIQNQYESQIYAKSGAQSVTGPFGSIQVTTPNITGYTYSVYISVGSGTSPANLGVSSSGPSVGPYAGMAVQLPPATTVTITGIGTYQVPPAAPASGVTVYRSYVFGENYFAALELAQLEWIRLFSADKSDPLNQLRVMGWKGWDGAVLLNQQFGAAMESSASSTGAFG